MTEVGPLSLSHWQPLTAVGFSLGGDKSRFMKNPQRLVTSILIGSQRHQLRPVINQCLELVGTSCFDADALFAAVDDALPYFETDELPLDTSSLLVKMLKLFPPSFFASLSLETLISKAKSNIPLVSFVNILTAYYTLMSHHPLKLPFLNDVLTQTAIINDLKYFVTNSDEAIHDEVRIFAFHMMINIVGNCASHCKTIVDYIQSSSLSKTVDHLLDFIVDNALPVLCTSSSTPSRERFCSVLIGALSTDFNPTLSADEKTNYINRVLSKLVSLHFDESNYAVQRCMLRFFRDLTPLTPTLAVSDAVYSKLLGLCRSDFSDVRHQAEEISLSFGENCIACDQVSLDLVEITKQNMIDAVQVVQTCTNGTALDNFLPAKIAFAFVHCKTMITKCKCWDTGYARLKLVDNTTLLVDFSFDSSKEEDQDGVLLEDITKAIKELLQGFEDSRSLLVLFLLSIGHLMLQSCRRDATFSELHGDAAQAYFQCCTTVFWRFFGSNSAAFLDKSLGGYEVLREHPVWAILLTVAKSLSACCSLSKVSSPEHNATRCQTICKIIHRVLFSTLHFGLLEEYSNLLCSAVVAWPDTVVPEFESSLCRLLLSSEENGDDKLLELSPGEVRRGGGLSLAFAAMFNGLDRIGKGGEVDRILRKGILERFDQTTAQLSTQTTVFHVLRAIFAFGDSRARAKFQDDVANMAFLALKMSASFQTRNAAIQALSTVVHPLVAESISSVWKFERAFPTLWQNICKTCTSSCNQEVLAQTAALSILAKLNPLLSPSDADEKSAFLIDERFEDDLLAIATSSRVAYVRSAAASALVCIACSDPEVDPVKRASLLLSSIIQFANRWCSKLEMEQSFLPENAVHGLLLIVDRSVSMMQNSWFTVDVQPSSTSSLIGHLPPILDRACPSICATLRRLVKLTNPSAHFLHQMMANYLDKFS